MKFYGHANLQKNELQNAALQTVTSFPIDAVVGQVAFVNSIVYICVKITPAPAIWVPLTREITSYVHTEAQGAQTWSVTHNLGTTAVNVQVFDGSNRIVIPDDVQTTGPNTLTIGFNTSQAGRAVVLTGHIEGNPRPAVAYTFYQQNASTTWTINHNLGHNPIVRVFIGTAEVQPESITHPTTNQTVITFPTAQAGYATLI